MFDRVFKLLTAFVFAVLTVSAAGCLDHSAASRYDQEVQPPADDALHARIDAIIQYTLNQRMMNTSDQAAWQIVHGLEAYGRDLKISAAGETVGALEYLFQGRPLKGWNLRPGDHGVIAIQEPGSKTGQGHPDQWLGYLSQCGVKLDDKLVVGGKDYRVKDLLTQAQWDIFDGMEATWTLMAAIAWLPLDAKWQAKDGTTWTIERIVKMEADQKIGEGGCYGSHRLYALSLAVNRYMHETGLTPKQLKGPWQVALGKITQAKSLVREYQQNDGTISTALFAGPSKSNELGAKLYAGGHTLEFLAVALTPDEIDEPWVTLAVSRLCDQMEAMKEVAPDCGALYHGAHGLMLYRDARFGKTTKPFPQTAAQ